MSTVSKLPSAQQEKRQQLERQQAEQGNAPTGNEPATNQPPANQPPAAPPQPPAPKPPESTNEPAPTATPPKVDTNTQTPITTTEQVSLTREELNQLRADAEQVRTIRNKNQMLELELAEARQGLTSAPAPSSDGVTGAPPAAAPAPSQTASTVLEVGDTSLTPDEQRDYEESEPVITKLAKREAAALINKALAPLVGRLASLEDQLRNTSTRMQARETQGFVGRVKEKVPNFDTIVHHAHWKAFLDSSAPDSAFTYGEELSQAHGRQNLDAVAKVLNTFAKKYLPDSNAGDAYAAPNVTAVQTPPTPPAGPEMLKMSERRKASDDYIKGRITKEQLQAITDKFRVAEREVRIDYDN